ncbi:hypothetical protein M0804_014922 [Polistes exclamans]|nr:hypothetical protein M0804_014923 [Polistes exclamans]KAI4474308.1 hypothetical protein M0804_014922 [Polistes exclamans]
MNWPIRSIAFLIKYLPESAVGWCESDSIRGTTQPKRRQADRKHRAVGLLQSVVGASA